MREPKRIRSLLIELEIYWRRNPDLRLGQIVGNFATGVDPYYVEDDVIERCLREANGAAVRRKVEAQEDRPEGERLNESKERKEQQ